MKYEFYTCDVFTDVRFGGNPLAIVLKADGLSGQQMQKVAREFNLSETIFVMRAENQANTAAVRIFTPMREMNFAGHPTIGSACLIAHLSQSSPDFRFAIVLEEKAGLVPVDVVSRNGQISAQLTAPDLAELNPHNCDVGLVAQALALNPAEIGFDTHQMHAVLAAGNGRLFVPLKNLDALTRAMPSPPAFSEVLACAGVRSIVVYTRGGREPETEFSVRNFAPASGIPEDPATGSAIAMLPNQIEQAENLSEGTFKWRIEQGFDMGRPSTLFLEADRTSGGITQIRVGGGVIWVSKGEIEI